ncbi:putative L-ascorbate peroxidase 7, chloroplastic [Cymbomonas tetramitiformis]|uniref:L-ascorbate peroxidase n=1 Tax=Cymbomonas tetramitiformis TaxID=36881 RepID=A0AAE0KX17_9CHLO|nr:putative L-ascorbate peroxidase 7, chloroplastic [Cymbomonas tetramitiformis]
MDFVSRAQARIHGLVLKFTHAPQGQEDYRRALKKCREELRKFIDETNCHPILVRLAWHDAGTFDKGTNSWPECGGANGSIRFEPELNHGANAGLVKAVNFLKKLKNANPQVSWADLIQLAGSTAIEVAGGPTCPVRYGRVDTEIPEQCPKEGNLPGAAPPFDDGSATPADHLRKVFYRMGFNDREIVALSGAHTIGRAFKERSGTVENGYAREDREESLPALAAGISMQSPELRVAEKRDDEKQQRKTSVHKWARPRRLLLIVHGWVLCSTSFLTACGQATKDTSSIYPTGSALIP